LLCVFRKTLVLSDVSVGWQGAAHFSKVIGLLSGARQVSGMVFGRPGQRVQVAGWHKEKAWFERQDILVFALVGHT